MRTRVSKSSPRRRWSFVAAALAGATSIVGLAPAAVAASPPQTITLWLVNGGTNPPLNSIAQVFERSHPGVNIDITYLPNNNAGKQKLSVAMAGNTPPTIFVTSGGGGFSPYVDAGKVVALNQALKSYGNWQAEFSKASFGPVTFNGKIYAIPILGSQPAMVYYNKDIFSKLHLTTPTTWAEMVADAAKVKSAGLIPFALGNSEGWPGLIWEEMLVDRIGGGPLVGSILGGASAPWASPAVVEANTMIQELVKDGYFQPGYSAVDYSDGEPNALMFSGKAAMQLMLSFGYSQMQTADASFVNQGHLGWFPFPTVPGGKGNPADEEGNVGQYAAITTGASPALQKLAGEFLADEMGSAQYAKLMLEGDEAPLMVAAEKYLNDANSFTQFAYGLAVKAPYYGDSWDNTLPAADGHPLLSDLESVFTLSEAPSKFSSQMVAVAKSAG
jgi:raffinose/stachyose/melibiose transport system substrate-binding protein